MKEETEISPVKQKEGHRKNQTSIFDFIKYNCEQNEADIDQSKNQLNTQSQQKEFANIKQIEMVKQQQTSPQNQQLPSHQYAFNNSIPIHSYSGWNNADFFSRSSTKHSASVLGRFREYFMDKINGIFQLEFSYKEEFQPYWRNKLLLFMTLIFLIIGNVFHMYFDPNLTKYGVSMRIVLITVLVALLGLSHLMLYLKTKGHNSSTNLNIPILSCCFSENQTGKKLITQIFIIVVCLMLFVGYAKCISETFDYSSSNSTSSSRLQNQINSQSLTVQLIEVILLYQYASTFFLSFFLLKMAFMISVFMINFFLLGFHENLNNYYYFIAFFIQSFYIYESTVVSVESQTHFNKNRYISTTSFPTEMRQPLKSPKTISSPGFQNYMIENFKKYQNQVSDTQRFCSVYNKKYQYSKRNHTLEDIAKRGSYAEAFGMHTINTDQNDYQIKQSPTFSRQMKTSSKVLNQEDLNKNNLQRKKKRGSKIENFLLKDSEDLEYKSEMNEYRSSKKQSGGSQKSTSSKAKNFTLDNKMSDYVNGELSSGKSNHNNNNKPYKYDNSHEHNNNRLEVSIEDIDQVKMSTSEPSKGNIKSQKDLQKSSSSSQTLSNQNIKSMISSDISPKNRIHRNFSLFRRLQEQIQIEEKSSQEEAETYAFTPHRNEVETFALHRSNSLGMLQSRPLAYSKAANNHINQIKLNIFRNQQNNSQILQNSQLSINPSAIMQDKNNNQQFHQHNGYGQSAITNQNNLLYSFTDKSQDEDQRLSEQNEQQKENGDQISDSIKLKHKLKMKQLYSRNRQVSIEYKRDKLNGYSLNPLGFQRTYTSSYSMAANMHQKTKLYKNILKYLPEEGVVLIDKNHNIHFANQFIQQLFPKSNVMLLFNELVQLKNIETLENYNQYLNEILEQKCQDQNENKQKNDNIGQNFTRVQLTDSININNNQEQNNQQYWIQAPLTPNQNQISQIINNPPPIQKTYSKTSLRNIQYGNTSQIGNVKTPKENTTNSNNQSYNNQNTFTQFQQQTSHYIHMSSNYNIPVGGFSPYVASSASINPTQRLSQSNYFMKMDLFKQGKEKLQLKENIIKCKSFLEQFDQIIENFRQLSISYKQFGIASQNKYTTLLYRPLNNQKQESIEDVQIFEVQFIPCYLGYTEGVVVTIRDVTHFNQIKVLKDINERKSNLLRNVSHELRQPLNCIISMMQLTRDSQNDQTLIQEYINPTLYSCQILLNLLNDFLDFSQIQAGTFKLTNIYFNIKKLFQNIFQMMKAQIQIRSLNFILNIVNESDIPDEIKSDPHRIQQIITNLLGNAVKFTEQGDIVLTLERLSPNIYKISVQDSGIGITEEGQKNLFKAFGKVDQDAKSILNPHGVGLGLMISNILAKQIGPSEDKGLQVESQIGQGTKFFFYLIDKTFQDKELVSFTPFNNNNKDKQISPQNLQNNFPYVRRTTSKNMETSVLFQGQPIDSQEDFCTTNSVQIVLQPLSMIPRQQHLNQICSSTNSIENVQDSAQVIENFAYRNPLMKNLQYEVHENNIKKIDLKNTNYLGNTINNDNLISPQPHKRSFNYVITNKVLDVNMECGGGQEKEANKGCANKKKTQLQQSQFIAQGIVLRQQTLILQQDYSPRAQKQLLDEIISYQKQRQLRCQFCNTKDIMIVDDNDFNIYVLDKYLKSFSIESETSTNGPSSEKKVKEKIENSKCEECKQFKIIFMDLNLGQTSGIQVANNIKQIYFQHKLPSPVIIACTGHVDENTVQSCFQNGFNDFLAKPIMKDQLVDMIQKYLKVEQ